MLVLAILAGAAAFALGGVVAAMAPRFFRSSNAAVVGAVAAGPAIDLAPSAAALVVLAPFLFSGYRHVPRKIRRRVRRLAFALGLGVVLCSLAGLVALLSARPHVQGAISAARHGFDAAKQADQS